jgi:flagellar hook-associated protein FlgK
MSSQPLLKNPQELKKQFSQQITIFHKQLNDLDKILEDSDEGETSETNKYIGEVNKCLKILEGLMK